MYKNKKTFCLYGNDGMTQKDMAEKEIPPIEIIPKRRSSMECIIIFSLKGEMFPTMSMLKNYFSSKGIGTRSEIFNGNGPMILEIDLDD